MCHFFCIALTINSVHFVSNWNLVMNIIFKINMIIAGLSGTGTLSAKSLKNVPSLLAAVKKTWSRQQHYFCYSWDQCQTQTKKNILKEQYQRNRQYEINLQVMACLHCDSDKKLGRFQKITSKMFVSAASAWVFKPGMRYNLGLRIWQMWAFTVSWLKSIKNDQIQYEKCRVHFFSLLFGHPTKRLGDQGFILSCKSDAVLNPILCSLQFSPNKLHFIISKALLKLRVASGKSAKRWL